MRIRRMAAVLGAVVITAVGGVSLAVPAGAAPSQGVHAVQKPLPIGPDGKRVIAWAKPVPMSPNRKPDAVWTENGGPSDQFATVWDLDDGAMYASYKFAVNLFGQSGMWSDTTRRICINSVLTHIDANDGTYYIRLHNEYTPSARSSGYSAYVAFPVVLNVQYGYCWTSLPDYDRGDVYVAQFMKKNTTHYYSGHIIATR